MAFRLAVQWPSEREEQEAFFKRVELERKLRIPDLAFVFHVPNGAFLGYSRQRGLYGQILKNLGLRPGVPDILCPIRIGDCPGLAIELKKGDSSPSDVSDEQKKWLAFLASQGWRSEVCKGWVPAWNVLCAYLEPTYPHLREEMIAR